MNAIRVLVVDDHPLVRRGFRMVLEADAGIDVVGEASDGLQAVAVAQDLKPDVVLMDIRMPNLDGIAATRRLLEGQGADLKVLILTTFDLDEYVYDALRAGASGFLLKDVPPERLIEGIRSVASGESLLAPSVTRRLIEAYVERGFTREPATALASLTGREREVLELMARGLSNAEIANFLFLGESTVKTHVTRVLDKLEVRDRVQAVVYAYERGVVAPGGD